MYRYAGGVANVWQRWIVNPLMGLLRRGADPDKLAWSLALGVVVGVNPLLGSTTVVVLALAAVFRLNIVASQVGNHAVYPLEWLLFPVFIKLGDVVFGTEKLPARGTCALVCGETSSVGYDAAAVELGVACAGGVGGVCGSGHAADRKGQRAGAGEDGADE